MPLIPAAPLARLRARRRQIPLRITLVALLVGLVAVALLATGAAATSLLRGYLQSQQDGELRSVLSSAQRSSQVLATCAAPPDRLLPSPTYLACIPPGGADAVVVAGPPRRERSFPDLDGRALRHVRGHDRAITVHSADGRTRWRVAAAPIDQGYTVLIGVDLERDQDVIGRLVALQVALGLVVLTVLGGAGYALVRNSLRPLTDVERTAQAIAAGDLSRRVPAGDERTEVGRLSRALNGMLGRIEAAFRAQQASEEQARTSEERMRRFVADASHELRTPLTSIRGFAELYRQGAVGTPEDTRRLMHRIEAEGSRMGLLVEDLLLLARLDQQRPLSLGPVDLAHLAGDAVHDARTLQPDRPMSLHLDESLTDAPVVQGDEARLRQVVGNLVTNALAHTPTAARVTISLAEDAEQPDAVVLRVADEGPGLSAEDAARVFERFYRADASRAREAGGTGLGLAIVASLVGAHGGTVALDTAPGRGANFKVRLPRSGPPEPPTGMMTG